MTKRPVIVHYHLFKNAGTSVDRLLHKNFGDEAWAEIEGPNNRKLDPEPLLDFIRENPHLKAVSSHTAVVSVPDADDIEILPIFFLRHPIDRIRSAYDFERKQDAQTPGAIKAKEGDFKHYMDWRLTCDTPWNPWQVSNFHAMRLKDFHEFTPAKQLQLFLPRAKRAVDALPTVGFVEDFDGSMQRVADHVRPYFPDFQVESVRANVTAAPHAKLEENLKAFEERIGSDVYKELEAANEIDFDLYQYALDKT
ncbi:MAG: sulfotransferase family 2 domain-containing protein [Litorimonas sp.]